MSFKDTLQSIFTGKDVATNIIAFMFLGFCMTFILLITLYPIPKDNMRAVDTILGFILGTGMSLILSYYFGASKARTIDITNNSNNTKENG